MVISPPRSPHLAMARRVSGTPHREPRVPGSSGKRQRRRSQAEGGAGDPPAARIPDGHLTIAGGAAARPARCGRSSYRGPVKLDGLGRQLLGAVAYAEGACRLGPVAAVYVDVDSGRPDFVGVELDCVSRAERLVPLVRANLRDDGRMIVALTADAVVHSPRVTGSDLSRDDSDELFRYDAESITGTSWGRSHRPGLLAGDGPLGLRRITPATYADRVSARRSPSAHVMSGA